MGLSPLGALLVVFWLWSTVAIAANAVIGIDFGTEYITAALVKPGIPLDIVLTKDSRRKELSAVAFKPIQGAATGSYPERLYGSDAVALSARFPHDVYPNLRAILGLKVDDPQVKEFSDRYPGLLLGAESTRNTAQFNSGAFSADAEPWMVEEILAMELQSIQKNAESMAGKGSIIKDVVITIPPYFDAEEKRAILLAADLAGLRVLNLITDGLAVGLNYATSRTFPSTSDGGKPEVNLLFDMGAGSTKATVLRFQGKTVKNAYGSGNRTIQQIEVLGSGWDRTLGGDALNSLIVDDMIAKFVESKPAKAQNVDASSVKAHPRANALLWRSAEKLRQVLSANVESSASFEGVYNDIDFRYRLTRADFEKFAASHAKRVRPVVDAALQRAGLSIADIDSVILTGGGTRTPFVQKELKSLVGVDRIKTNVNADEAAVFGAAFKGASLSPSFRVKEIRTFEAAQYDIGMKWTNVNLKAQKQRLYNAQSFLGSEKILSFQNLEDFDVHFYQLVGTDTERAFADSKTSNLTATVAELKEKYGCKKSDILVKIGVRLSLLDGELEVTSANAQCETLQEEKKGALEGVKGMFGFGKKDGAQDPLADSDIVAEASTETSSTESNKTGKVTASSNTSDSTENDAKTPQRRLVTIPVAFSLKKAGYPPLPKDVFAKKKDRLKAFDNSDKKRQQREEALNQLEAFTYRVRDKLDDESFITASTVVERTKLLELAEAASEWLYGDGHSAPREELRSRLKELEALLEPIERRRSEASLRPVQVAMIQEVLGSAKELVQSIKNDISAHNARLADAAKAAPKSSDGAEVPAGDEADDLEVTFEDVTAPTEQDAPKGDLLPYPITEEEINKSAELFDNITKWLEEKLSAQSKLLDTEEPIVTSKEIAERANEVLVLGNELTAKKLKAEQELKKKEAKRSAKASPKKKAGKAKASEEAQDNKADGENAKPRQETDERWKDEL